ncbi:MAG: hypothetical protein E6J91_44940 [Deltaproteobacteria bacterium]|nr:MAG: hypothetical protein E6J91_44940 [Deltaproteobacteria bacterium]
MLASGGLEIHPLCAADYIEPAAPGYRVHFTRLDPDQPGKGEPASVVGKQVVVSAGSLGSTQLLLRSRDRNKTLPDLPVNLGRRFSGNGDMLFSGTLGAERVIEPGEGPSITIGGDFSRKGSKHRFYIEDLGFPNPFLWLLEGSLPSVSAASAWSAPPAATSAPRSACTTRTTAASASRATTCSPVTAPSSTTAATSISTGTRPAAWRCSSRWNRASRS